MFSDISWKQYFTYLAVAGTLYYLFIWLIFFKAKFSILSGNFRSVSLHAGNEDDEIAKYIMDEMEPVFNGARSKSEIIPALQQLMKRYKEYEEPGFREQLNKFIAAQCESKCSIRLSESDLRVVWS